jgi:hypothetical protein
MKECSTPPSEAVEWSVWWGGMLDVGSGGCATVTARTAFEAHRQVPGAPSFGSCRVQRTETIQPKTAENRRR